MPTATPPNKPVTDSVPKVNNDVAVGADLEFQRKWWRFERSVWIFFAFLVLCDLAGLFGRGPLAHAHRATRDGTMDVHYERIERFSTPSIATINFGPNAIHDGKIQLWVGGTLVKRLGAQRVVPAPLASQIGDDGITYTFPASFPPASVEFALQPAGPGLYPLEFRVLGAEMMTVKVFVMP